MGPSTTTARAWIERRSMAQKRAIPFAVLFAVILTFTALLPLYVERTMTHVMFADGSGGAIRWGWKRCTLRGYCADYRYMRREQKPALWLGINSALGFVFGAAPAVGVRTNHGPQQGIRGFPPLSGG